MPTVRNPKAVSDRAVAAAWPATPEPFNTDTDTDDGAGRG